MHKYIHLIRDYQINSEAILIMIKYFNFIKIKGVFLHLGSILLLLLSYKLFTKPNYHELNHFFIQLSGWRRMAADIFCCIITFRWQKNPRTVARGRGGA